MNDRVAMSRRLPFPTFLTLLVPALALAATVTAAELVQDGGFESGGLTAWPNVSGIGVVGSPVHSGTKAIQITLYPGPSAYVSQSIGAQMLTGEAYVFSGWVYLTSTNLPPMPMYVPRIRVSPSADLHDAFPGGERAVGDVPPLVVGWNFLQFTRTFTAQELSAAVYFGAIRVGGPGDYVFDDLSVSGAAAPPTKPQLSLALTPTNSIVLAWPATASGFLLQESQSLQAANWATNAAIPVVIGASKQVVLPAPTGNRFYRLIQPAQ